VRKQKALEADEHGQQHALCEAVGEQDAVEHLLRGRAVELDPAGIALRERVGEVRLEAPRGQDRAVHVHGDERDSLARRTVELFVRVQQALRRGRGERADAGTGRRDCEAEHRMLALEVGELDVLATGAGLGEPFDDQRLRRDRIAGDHLCAREHDRQCDRVVCGHHSTAGARACAHAAISSSRSAPCTGQTTSQMPQPLQWR
jgi:hypothetical protein